MKRRVYNKRRNVGRRKRLHGYARPSWKGRKLWKKPSGSGSGKVRLLLLRAPLRTKRTGKCRARAC